MNASYREFSQHNFIARIGDALSKHQLAHASLELDLREESLLRNPHLGREIVIAEGGETASQLDFLRSHGCDEVQGAWFSAPLEQDALERFIRGAA